MECGGVGRCVGERAELMVWGQPQSASRALTPPLPAPPPPP